MDNINLADSGIRFPRVYRAAGYAGDEDVADGQFDLGPAPRLSPHVD